MWYDVVYLEDKKEFLKLETLFTYGELKSFHRYPEGIKKEEARNKVLELRKLFLIFWCKIRKCRII